MTFESIAEKLARYAVGLEFNDLPLEVIEKTRMLLLDAVGCAIGAYTSPPSKKVRALVTELGGRPESTIIGSGVTTSCPNATLANSTMIRFLDYNDTYWGLADFSHPSSNIAPALAVGERQHASGSAVITAIVVGYEVQARFNDAALPPGPRKRGFDHSTITSFSSPIVAGKLLGLTREEMANAIGISGCHNLTLQELEHGSLAYHGYMWETKALRDAWPSSSGVMAALLAQKGYGGPLTIIEGAKGLAQSGYSDYDLDALVHPPDPSFKILKVHLKAFNSNFGNMSRIDAAIRLVTEHDIRAADVKRVTVSTHDTPVLWDHEKYQPRSREMADHSAPFAIAMAIMDREMGVDQYVKCQWRDPQVRALMARIRFLVDPELEKLSETMYPPPSVVEVQMKTGKCYRSRVDHAKGTVYNPLTRKEVEGKFRSMASKLLSEDQVTSIIDTIHNLEQLDDIKALMELVIA